MSESLYVPIGLISAGIIGWLAAGVVSVLTPSSVMSIELLKAGTAAMALGGTAYQAQVMSSTTKTKQAPRRQTKAKPDSDSTP